MANTVIQIRRATTTDSPANGRLSVAEPAYSFLSDKLYIGNTTSGAIAIGGKFFVDQQNTIFNAVNAAFSQANTDTGFTVAYDAANAAFAKANSWANTTAQSSNAYASTILQANVAAANAYSGSLANTINANVALSTSAANVYAGVILQANVAAANAYSGQLANTLNANVAFANTTAIAAFQASNGVNTYSQATYLQLTKSNQTITGNISITGNLIVSGNSFTVDTTSLNITDPLIYLAGNNYTQGVDIVDIGFIANYTNSTTNILHTGLLRSAKNKQYYLFENYSVEPFANNTINTNDNNFTVSTLNANLTTGNLWLSGINLSPWVSSVYDKANTANLLAYNTGIGANAWANNIGVVANAYASSILQANVAAANAWTNAVFGFANNKFLANALVGATNTYAYTGNLYITTGNVLIGRTTDSTNGSGIKLDVNGAVNASAYFGTWYGTQIGVAYGGTGLTSIANGSILYANGPSTIATTTGSDGNVLQVNSYGTPFFGMLDGGTF